MLVEVDLTKEELLVLIENLDVFNNIYEGYLSILEKLGLMNKSVPLDVNDKPYILYSWSDDLLNNDETSLYTIYMDLKENPQKAIQLLCAAGIERVSLNKDELYTLIQGMGALDLDEDCDVGITPKDCADLVEFGIASKIDDKTWVWSERLLDQPIKELETLYKALTFNKKDTVKEIVKQGRARRANTKN